MNKYLPILFLLLVSFNSRALAEPGAYVAIGGGWLDFDDGTDTVKPKQLLFRVGYNFNDYIGLGYEYGFSLLEDRRSGDDLDVTTGFTYLRGSFPVNDTTSIYGLFGSTNVELRGISGGGSVPDDNDGTGIGIGLERQVWGAEFFADYISYYDKDDVDVHSFNFGATFSF